MSANAIAAEAAASEVLDLNADATAVDSQEHTRAPVADDTKPIPAEALIEPSMSFQVAAEEGLGGGGMCRPEDGKREVVAEAGDAEATARPAEDMVTGGREGWEGMVVSGGVVEGQDDRSGGSAEATEYQSTRTEIIVEQTGVAVEYVDGSGNGENHPLRADQITEGSPEPNGGKSSPEVGHAAQETSGANLDKEVEVDVGMIPVHSQPIKEKDHRGDVAPDLNSAVDIVHSVESENMCPQPVIEKSKDQDDAVVSVINHVTGAAAGEMLGENTIMSGENVQKRGHIVTGDATSAAEIILLPTTQTSKDPSHHCPTQVDVPTDIGDRYQDMGEKHENTSLDEEKPASRGDAGVINTSLADKLPSVHRSDDPKAASTKGDCNTSQVTTSDGVLPNKGKTVTAHPDGRFLTDDNSMDTECVTLSDSNLVAEECVPESSQPAQNLPGMLKQDPSQVEVSAGQFPSENQSTVQHVGSLLDENEDSQPILGAGQDVSLTTCAKLETKHESIGTNIIPSEGTHVQEVNLNKKENDRVNLPSDNTEDEVAGTDTGGDQKELNVPEPLDEDKSVECPTVKPGSAGTENNQRASYHLPQEDKTAAFSISDLVWGKVKSHPWWPGQIFDPLDASDMALKHQKRDNFLVAYFGDKTFAWCDESKLKPFQACFSQLENQSTTDVFVNAVNSAVAEVSRRVELGMSCICVPEAVISNLKHQEIENAGIREGSSCSVVDKSFGVTSFEPNNFLDYIKALVLYPLGGTDKLELVMVKAQLMAFNHSRGRTELSASYGGDRLLENDAATSTTQRKRRGKALGEHPSPTSAYEEVLASALSAGKRKKKSLGSVLQRQKDIPEHGRKQKSLSELMDDKRHSDLVNGDGTATEMESCKSPTHSSGKKRKKDDSTLYLGKSKRKRLDDLGDLEKKTPTSDRSFKVGECISRVASKLTGSPSIIKCNGESLKKGNTGKADQGSPQVFDVSAHTPEDTRRTRKGMLKNNCSLEEILSQLCLAASDPMKGYSFLSALVCFFTEVRGLRDSGPMLDKHFEKIKKKRGRKKKSESVDNSKNKLSGTHTPQHLNLGDSSSVMDEKSYEKIGRKRGRKKKSESKEDSKTDITEASAVDYMADSYWTDRVVCSTPEEKPQSSRRKRKGELLMQSATKRTKPSPESLPLSKMLEAAHHLRISAVSPTANRDSPVEKQATFFGEKCLEESTPTALILSFNEAEALPSETNLIRIFSRYGPLKEAETEVLNETNCAKVVFKRRADAEIAFSSAGKYCFFGPALVSFRLRYLASTPMASPEARPDGRKDTKTSNGVSLEIPAQEEAKELAQGELKESAKGEVKDLGQGETKELSQGEAKELSQQEAKELAHEEAKDLTQEEAKESAQDESKDLTQEEAKKSAQDEVKDLAQDEMKEFSQEEVKKLAKNEADKLTEKEGKGSALNEVKDIAQDEGKDLTQEQGKELATDKVREVTQEEAKELYQAEAKE